MKIATGETILRFELPEEQACILYRRCTLPLFKELGRAHIADERKMLTELGSMMLAVADKCIAGWEGVFDEDASDKLVEFSPDIISLLPETLRLRVGFAAAEHIMKVSREEVAKQLESVEERLRERIEAAMTAPEAGESPRPLADGSDYTNT